MDKTIYPQITIERIKNPNRLYAFPIFGFLVKIIILIPVFLMSCLYALMAFFTTSIINPFIVLSSGKYWDTAYEYNVKWFSYSLKIWYYLNGLTDKYPGFDPKIDDAFSVTFAKPQNPNKFFAIPLIGGLVRIILMIPYIIYFNILSRGASVGVMVSSIPVLFTGTYPESTFEFSRDASRVVFGGSMYLSGMSDQYPSFKISMNHKVIKIILIIVGILAFLSQMTAKSHSTTNYQQNMQYNYQITQ